MMPDRSPTGHENGAEAPIEIARRPLRILLTLLIANLAALIAILALGVLYSESLLKSDGLVLTFGFSFGILTLAVVCAPAVAFLVHTRGTTTSVTPRLRNSALASAVAPFVVGLWSAAANEGVWFVTLGVVLLLLAVAVIVRAFTAPRADAGANRFVLRPEASFVGVALVLLNVALRPNGPPPSKFYVSAMKSDLRNLVMAQEIYFDSTQRYQSDPALLRFAPSRSVHAPTISLTDSGWSATNTHSRLRGIKCAVAVQTTNPVNAAAKDGEPACTDSVPKP